MTNLELPWNSAHTRPNAPHKSKKRFMVYHPMYGGYVFRCWYDAKIGFGCDDVESMISDVTHWRPAGKTEKSRQLTVDELSKIDVIGEPIDALSITDNPKINEAYNRVPGGSGQ